MNKKSELNLLGIPVIVELTYPNKYNKLRFILPRSYFKIFSFAHLITIFLLMVHVFNMFPQIDTYITKQLPFSTEVYHSITQPRQERKITKKVEKMIFHGDRSKKQVALTFDADMTPEMIKSLKNGKVESYYDSRLIDLLNNTRTKATLFLSGMWIEEYKDVAINLSQNSLFELANHSYSHPAFEKDCYGLQTIPDTESTLEIVKTQILLKEITGSDNKLFRFPGGCYSEPDLEVTSKIGVIPIQWDVAGRDGFNEDMVSIVANVISNVKNGSIIVLHMNGYPSEPETANALPFIISTLREKGYEFVTVSELLSLKEITPKDVNTLFSLKLD